MNALGHSKQDRKQQQVAVNDDLKNDLGAEPLFTEKLAKAVQVMTLVRKRQQEEDSSSPDRRS